MEWSFQSLQNNGRILSDKRRNSLYTKTYIFCVMSFMIESFLFLFLKRCDVPYWPMTISFVLFKSIASSSFNYKMFKYYSFITYVCVMIISNYMGYLINSKNCTNDLGHSEHKSYHYFVIRALINYVMILSFYRYTN
jgi:hypothetical protein